MKLNNLEIIDTEVGKIPVIVNEVVKDNEVTYNGKLLYGDMKISIITPTKKSCLEGLKNSFEVKLFFWLSNQIKSLGIKFTV